MVHRLVGTWLVLPKIPSMKLPYSKLASRLAPERSVPQSLLLLVVRLYWGWQFFATGKGKLTNIAKVGEYFQSLGLPLPQVTATLVGLTESIGGIFLLIGVLSRLTSIPLTILLVVAYCTADLEAVKSIFSNPDKFLSADPFLFLYAVMLMLVFGPGRFSIDWIIGHKIAPTADGSGNAAKQKGFPASSVQLPVQIVE
jgi:putative oxidoreductase